MVSRLAGRDDREAVSSLLKKSLFLCALVMGIFHGACFVFLEPIFLLMGASPDYMAEALDYGAPALLSVYFTSLALILQAVQLGYGDTASIMKTNIAGNGINGALSFVLISGMGPIPAFGVRGAAIGTIVGTLFTLLASFYLLKSKGFSGAALSFRTGLISEWYFPFWQHPGRAGERAHRHGPLLPHGGRAGDRALCGAQHLHEYLRCVLRLHHGIREGRHGGIGAVHRPGKPAGLGGLSDLRPQWCLILSAAVCGAVLLFSDEIFSFYSKDPSLLAMSGTVMVIIAIVSFPEALAIWGAGVLRGSGRTAQVAAYSFVSITFLRPLVTAFFLYVLDMGLLGTWCALLLDQVIRAACATFLVARLSAKDAPWHWWKREVVG